MKTVIINCHLISAGLDIEGAFVEVVDGKITAVGTGAYNAAAGVEVVDAKGNMLVPGFVDVHCHGRNNYDFCDGDAEGVKTIAQGKLSEGVTTLLPTTLTLPEEELTKALASIAAYDNSGCKLPGVHLEGPYINPKCVGAQNPAYVRALDADEVDRLNAVYPVKKITYAVEMPNGPEFTAAMLTRGITPSCTHSGSKYSDFKAGYNAGLRNLSHFCNQMTPLHHRDIGLVGAGLLHKDVYAELICDKLHICPEMINLTFSVKSPDHVVLISDAMRAAGMPDGEYSLGGLPVIVSEGAARLKEGGALAGSTLKINVALKNINEVTDLPLSELIKSATLTPALSIGLKDIGKIEPGYCADMVMLDDNFEVVKTWVDGQLRFEA